MNMARKTYITDLLYRSLRSVLVVFGLLSATSAQADVNPMNVLFIGNSYTHMNKMPQLFEKIATSKGVKINVEMDAKSNHTFKMHSERPELYEHIKEKKWDYVVLQGFSRELSYSKDVIDTASVPYITKIVDSIYMNNPCTNVLLYMTWGYKEGFKDREEINSYEKMSDSVKVGYEYISDLFDFPIVPVGSVYKELMKNYPSINLYQPDYQHPTIYGSYLIASTFYSAIFKASPAKGDYSKIDEAEASEIQSTAYNYVINHIDEYKLGNNTLKVKSERDHKGRFYVHCEANYPCSVDVHWDFGDGNKSKESKVQHRYKESGTYWVTLRVEDMCGERTVKRKVVFKDPPKPTKKRKSSPTVVKTTEKRI